MQPPATVRTYSPPSIFTFAGFGGDDAFHRRVRLSVSKITLKVMVVFSRYSVTKQADYGTYLISRMINNQHGPTQFELPRAKSAVVDSNSFVVSCGYYLLK